MSKSIKNKESVSEKETRANKKEEGIYILKNINKETIKTYIDCFNKSQENVEKALKEVFERYKNSNNIHETLIKVLMLNQLYSAGLNSNEPLDDHRTSKKVNIYMMANALTEHVNEINEWLADKDPCVAVNNILDLFPENDRPYSFVTKYCSWCMPLKYPIADSYSKGVLYYYFKETKKYTQKDFGNYEFFCNIYNKFKEQECDENSSIKDVDKFLWSFGKKYGIQI